MDLTLSSTAVVNNFDVSATFIDKFDEKNQASFIEYYKALKATLTAVPICYFDAPLVP